MYSPEFFFDFNFIKGRMRHLYKFWAWMLFLQIFMWTYAYTIALSRESLLTWDLFLFDYQLGAINTLAPMAFLWAVMLTYNGYLMYKLTRNLVKMIKINLELHSKGKLKNILILLWLIAIMFGLCTVLGYYGGHSWGWSGILVTTILQISFYYRWKELLKFYPNDEVVFEDYEDEDEEEYI